MQEYLFLDRVIFSNTLAQWLVALGIVVLVTLGLRIAFRILLRRVRAIADRTATDLDDLAAELLEKTRTLFILLIAIWAGSRGLELPQDGWLDKVLRGVLIVGLLLQGGFWGMGVIGYLVKRQRKRQLEEDPGMATAIGAAGFIANLALWSILLLTALGTFGVDITARVASLGIGGVAVALALQNVLGDLFASLSIVLDKPFVLGDFIIVGDFMGTVEHVGLKTTRIRSLSGEQIVFSNSDLLASRIRNYKRMNERRALFAVGVTYDTPSEKLRRIPEIIRSAVESQDQTRFDRSNFKQFGASSLDFETVYFMLVPDYNTYMATQEAINLELVERFAEQDIEFAFPTRTLYVASNSSSGSGTEETARLG
jgi:small-conductance mechanosensitive channel